MITMNPEKPTSSDFYEVSKSIHFVNKCLGLSVWTLKGEIGSSERRYVISNKDTCLRTFIFLLWGLFTGLYFYFCPIKLGEVQSISYSLMKYVSLLVILNYVLFSQIKRVNMLNIITKVYSMDKELELLIGEEIDYGRFKKIPTLYLVVLYCSHIPGLISTAYECEDMGKENYCSFFSLPMEIMAVHINAFLMMILYYIKHRVGTLNGVLKKLERQNCKSISQKLTQARRVYNVVIDLVKEINKAFDVILLLKIVNCTLFLLASAYVCTISNMHLSLKSYFDTALWMLLTFLEICIIIYHFVALRDEARKTVKLMENVQSAVGRSHLAYKQVDLFSLQVYVVDFKFTVFGFFPLDWTLLHSMIAGITTYLVIFHQFSNMEKKSNN